jgi:hypothetical protein
VRVVKRGFGLLELRANRCRLAHAPKSSANLAAK